MMNDAHGRRSELSTWRDLRNAARTVGPVLGRSPRQNARNRRHRRGGLGARRARWSVPGSDDRHPADFSWARIGLRCHGPRSSISGSQRAHGLAGFRRHRGFRGRVRPARPALSHPDQRGWGPGSVASRHDPDHARTVERRRRAGPSRGCLRGRHLGHAIRPASRACQGGRQDLGYSVPGRDRDVACRHGRHHRPSRSARRRRG